MPATTSFGVLGPVEAWLDGRRLALGPPQQRTVLAVILLGEGLVVSVDELVEALWADEPPAGAVKTVRTYVSRLRAVLGPVGADIESVAGGYRLRVGPDHLDLTRFRRLTTPAAVADRAERAREALKLFRGDPLAGLRGDWAETHRAQLSYLRAAAHEVLYAAELEAGHHAQVIAEIPAVIRQFPFREQLRELQILALYQSGLRAEALAAYREIQEVLRDELGIEPMPTLQNLHYRMLQADPGLEPGPTESADPEPLGRVGPAQLPAAPVVFTGRHSELRRAGELLAASGPGPAIIVITGMGGVGKTSMALHWAHQLAAQYEDGRLYVDLRGYGPGGERVPAAEALAGFLQALGVTAAGVPEERAARAAMFRSLLADRRMLILLDNAATADQVLDLLPGAGASLVIVTSRTTLPGLVARTGAPLLALRPPAYEDALALFAERAGRERVRAERAAARDIVELSGRLPLALAVVGARAAAEAHLPLSAIAGDLTAAHGTLSAFRRPDAAIDVGAVLSWSYRALEGGPAEAFRLLGLHPGPDLNAEVAASMLARSVAETRELLTELVAAALVTEYRPGRWVIHDLVRAYAHDLALTVDSADQRRVVVQRLLDYYLYAGWGADSQLFKLQQSVVPGRPLPGVIGTDAEPAAWFGDEYPALLSALDLAVRDGFFRHAWQLSGVVRNFLNRQGLWHHLQTSQEAGHAAAIREGDPVAEARSLFGLALADSNMGRYAQAQTRLGRARTIFRQTGEQEAEERTTISIAGVFDLQGEWLAALNQYEPLLALHPRGTDRTARARILIGVSWAKVQLGRYAEAKADTLEIIGMGAHLRPFWLADTWDTLGRAQFGLGDLDEAAGSYRRAVELYQHHGAPVSAAESLRRLGDLLERAGRRPEAGQMYRQALVLAGQAGGPQAARLSAELSSVLAQHR